MAWFSLLLLSKSKRKLLVTLPIVGAVTGLGGVGIWQTQADKLGGGDRKAVIAKAALKKSVGNSKKTQDLKHSGPEAPGRGRRPSASQESPASRSLGLTGNDRPTGANFSRPSSTPARPFGQPPAAWRMPSPQETVIRGNGFNADGSPAGPADDEAQGAAAMGDSEQPIASRPSPAGQDPFGKRGLAAAGTAASSRRPGGVFQPPARTAEDSDLAEVESQPNDEATTEEPGEIEATEALADGVVDATAEDQVASASSRGQFNRQSFGDTAPEAASGHAEELADESLAAETPAPRTALAAPVELSLDEGEEASARPLRQQTSPTADEALAAPGPRHLEGVQTPTLTIEKLSPPEVQVNRPAVLRIIVRNIGQVMAQDVMVFDQAPQGARLEETTPPASQGPDGAVVWQLGDLAPGEQAEVQMRIVPQAEGELGSVAKVAFQAQATARSLSTRPQLAVKQTAPARVLIGQQVLVSITISNPGTGAAENVVLEETLPEGLAHPAGRELEYEVGMLRPGETRTLDLTLTADKAGRVDNRLIVRGAGELFAEDMAEIEVIAPQLDVAVKGPAKRYLQRPATYNIALLNEGTAPAKNVELVSYLPKGLRFLSANNQGRYDAPNHAVYWSLDELPAGAKGDVQVTAEPIEVGEQKLRVEGRADLGLAKVFEQVVLVEGRAELFYTVTDSADPIEVGADTIYQVRVVNQGSKVDTNIQVALELPPELEALAGEGPARHSIQGQQVVFDPLPRLAPQEEATFKLQVRGKAEGDHKVRVLLSSDESRSAVTKEESTRVYAD